jgi:hypothetical protein
MKYLFLLLCTLAIVSCAPVGQYEYVHRAVNVNSPLEKSYNRDGIIIINKTHVQIKDEDFKFRLKFDRSYNPLVDGEDIKVYENDQCLFFIKDWGVRFACLECAERTWFFYFDKVEENAKDSILRRL